MNKVLFISYVDMDRQDSGSGVRPVKMLSAIKNRGYDVITLSGNQMLPDRRKQIKEIKEVIIQSCVDWCYIESPVYPIMHKADRDLIRFIHRRKIPIGYFYRDFYRKFPGLFPRRTGLVNRIKDIYLDIQQKWTDTVLHNCDIIYLPSEQAKKLFSYADMRALPPAGENWLRDS